MAFVTVKGDVAEDRGEGDDPGRASCATTVARTIGPIAKPRQILLTPELPKTRSGKIMRRLLRDVAEHRELGDVTTLLDPTVVNMIDEKMKAAGRYRRRRLSPTYRPRAGHSRLRRSGFTVGCFTRGDDMVLCGAPRSGSGEWV